MLKILRNNAREVITATIILFVLSVFGLGALSFFSRNSGVKRNKVVQSEIGIVNNIPMDSLRFNRNFQQYFANIPQENRILLDPDFIDYYKNQAFQKTVTFMLMLEEAKKTGIKVLPQEINFRLDQYAKAYKLKNKRELKKILKKSDVDWNVFKEQQKEDIMVAKFVNGITSRVRVTDFDKKMAFTEIKTRHILIRVKEATDNVKADLEALKKAESIYELVLSNKKNFAKIAKQYSEDKMSAAKGGDLGWVGRGQMVPEFEKQLQRLKPGEIAGPIKTMFGYHIILAEDRREKPRPVDATDAQIDEQIRKDKQNEAMQKFLDPLRKEAKVEIKDSSVLAYDYRKDRKYNLALIEYQKMSSKQQSNLTLAIQVSRMYEELKQFEEQEKVLERAMLFQKYNPQYQYPLLYFAYIEFHKKNGKVYKAKESAEKVIEIFQKNKPVLEALLSAHKDVLSDEQIKSVENQIKKLTEEAEKADKQQQENRIAPE